MRTASALLTITLLHTALATAGDWPQILGPTRDGIAQNEKLADKWPAGGPRTLWQRPVGDGFSGVAVVSGKAILFHRAQRKEVAECLDALTGQPVWKREFDAQYVPSFTRDSGPRAVPLINGGMVYLYGARGDLHCLKLADGSVVWHRDTYEDYSGKRPVRGEPPEGYFGFGSTPILEGGRLLVNIGGAPNDAGIVAFDAATGQTVWKATDERASYSSPIAATIGGRRQVIVAARLNVLSVDPSNGQVLSSFPFGRTGPAVTAANPVVIGDHVFISASYGFGAVLAKLGATGAIEIWSSDDVLSSQYTTAILDDKVLFGIHGRQDVGVAELRCVEPLTRRVLWTQHDFGYATLIKADDKLLIMKTDGELILARPDKSKYVELDHTRLFTETARPLPALSNGLLYVRDESTLKCIDLR